MQPSDFQAGFPGVLEPTTFEEGGPGGEKAQRQGLAFVPHPLPPELDRTRLLGRLFDVLDRARTRLVRLDGLVDALPGRTALLSGLRIREARASSQIENTFASVQDTALAGLGALRPESAPAEVHLRSFVDTIPVMGSPLNRKETPCPVRRRMEGSRSQSWCLTPAAS